jgi:hypothetical protein
MRHFIPRHRFQVEINEVEHFAMGFAYFGGGFALHTPLGNYMMFSAYVVTGTMFVCHRHREPKKQITCSPVD